MARQNPPSTFLNALSGIIYDVGKTIQVLLEPEDPVDVLTEQIQRLSDNLFCLQGIAEAVSGVRMNAEDESEVRLAVDELDPESQLADLLSSIRKTRETDLVLATQGFERFVRAERHNFDWLASPGSRQSSMSDDQVKPISEKLEMNYRFHNYQVQLICQTLNRYTEQKENDFDQTRPKILDPGNLLEYLKLESSPITSPSIRNHPIWIIPPHSDTIQDTIILNFMRELRTCSLNLREFKLYHLLNIVVLWISSININPGLDPLSFAAEYVHLTKAAWFLGEIVRIFPGHVTTLSFSEVYLIEIQNDLIEKARTSWALLRTNVRALQRLPPEVYTLNLTEDIHAFIPSTANRPQIRKPLYSLLFYGCNQDSLSTDCQPSETLSVLRLKDRNLPTIYGNSIVISRQTTGYRLNAGWRTYTINNERWKFARDKTIFSPSVYPQGLDNTGRIYLRESGENPVALGHEFSFGTQKGTLSLDVVISRQETYSFIDLEAFQHVTTGYRVMQTLFADRSEVVHRRPWGTIEINTLVNSSTQIWSPRRVLELNRSSYSSSLASSSDLPSFTGPSGDVLSSTTSQLGNNTPASSEFSRTSANSNSSQASTYVSHVGKAEPSRLLLYGHGSGRDAVLIVMTLNENVYIDHSQCCFEKKKGSERISCCPNVSISWHKKEELAIYNTRENNIFAGCNSRKPRIGLPLDVDKWSQVDKTSRVKLKDINITFKSKPDKEAFVNRFNIAKGRYILEQEKYYQDAPGERSFVGRRD